MILAANKRKKIAWMNQSILRIYSVLIESLNILFSLIQHPPLEKSIYVEDFICKVCAMSYLFLYLHREEGWELFTSLPRKIRGNGKTGERERQESVIGHAEIPMRNNIFLWERKIWCERRHAVFWSMKNGSLNLTDTKQFFADPQTILCLFELLYLQMILKIKYDNKKIVLTKKYYRIIVIAVSFNKRSEIKNNNNKS